jgi:hypothetical protein
LLLLVRTLSSSAAELPRVLDAAPCTKAPTIDGVIDTAEWREARAHAFELGMVRIDPPGTEKRSAELRVMNSGNALYVALKVPDQTVNNRLSPLEIDAAILAFCQGEQVRASDDRKLIAQGIYRDKFVDAPGKDDRDDIHQDGRGAMTRVNGACSFEWAVPLDSGDRDDLRARPGDSFRFNVVYLDALQVPLSKTQMGGAYGAKLDNANDWGILRLAANVRDDGGSAFQSPAWVKALAQKLKSVSPPRLRVTDATLVPDSTFPSAKLLMSLEYLDVQGKQKEAKAKLFLPQSIEANENARHPVYFAAGYELSDEATQNHLRRGWIVVSPRELETNPLIRTANPDISLLHLVRALPWVDDAHVIIGGGSAGGWATLMLAAETFPLAGAAPDVPPMNWGYNAAYFFKQLDKAGPKGGTAPRVPAVSAVGTMLKQCLSVYGGDFDDPTWFADSPIAHLQEITCPVSVYWSTADVLVPINQIGARWVQPIDKSGFPEGFTMDPKKLMSARPGRLSLIDVLPESEYEVFNLTVPNGTSRHTFAAGPASAKSRELPASARKHWSITIIDEGTPEPGVDHRKYDLVLPHNAFLERVVRAKIATSQLTAAKLERLMNRYAGKEDSDSRLRHLDFPKSERADVLRGLRTYVRTSPENAKRFAELYAQLPPHKRVLGPDVMKELSAGRAVNEGTAKE